jgi:hypothetical protein
MGAERRRANHGDPLRNSRQVVAGEIAEISGATLLAARQSVINGRDSEVRARGIQACSARGFRLFIVASDCLLAQVSILRDWLSVTAVTSNDDGIQELAEKRPEATCHEEQLEHRNRGRPMISAASQLGSYLPQRPGRQEVDPTRRVALIASRNQQRVRRIGQFVSTD